MNTTDKADEGRDSWFSYWPWFVVALVVLVPVAVLLPVLFPRPALFNKATVDRIKEGMTRVEVEKILGGPPGNYSTRPVSCKWAGWVYRHHIDTWTGDEETIDITLDRHDRVLSITVYDNDQKTISTFELLRWRLEHWWNKITGTRP